jgi:hypothetical protein
MNDVWLVWTVHAILHTGITAAGSSIKSLLSLLLHASWCGACQSGELHMTPRAAAVLLYSGACGCLAEQ